MRNLRRYWLHLSLWFLMASYFLFAPDVFIHFFVKAGRPIPSENLSLYETHQVSFGVDGLEADIQEGQYLYSLNGWAYMVPEPGKSVDGFVELLSLVSDKQRYLFPLITKYHALSVQKQGIDPNTLGFSALIAPDTIKPGEYRIGIIFKDPSTGISYYLDKPAHYLIKTPNTIVLK